MSARPNTARATPPRLAQLLLNLEGAAVEGTRGVEDCVAKFESTIAERDPDLALGQIRAVEVGDPLIGACDHVAFLDRAFGGGGGPADQALMPGARSASTDVTKCRLLLGCNSLTLHG